MLKEKLKNDLNSALKKKEELRRVVLGSLIAAIVNKEKEKRTKLGKEGDFAELEKQSQLSDDEIIEVISSEVKKRKEAVEQYEKGGRQELAEKEKKELEILLSYMPEQLGEDKVRDAVKSMIEELKIEKNIKNMGQVMASVMQKLKGKADGGTVSRIVKEELTL